MPSRILADISWQRRCLIVLVEIIIFPFEARRRGNVVVTVNCSVQHGIRNYMCADRCVAEHPRMVYSNRIVDLTLVPQSETVAFDRVSHKVPIAHPSHALRKPHVFAILFSPSDLAMLQCFQSERFSANRETTTSSTSFANCTNAAPFLQNVGLWGNRSTDIRIAEELVHSRDEASSHRHGCVARIHT